MEISLDEKKIAKILARNFSPIFLLRCYRQVASIFTFISDHFVKLLLLKCLRSIKTRKLHVRIVVPKLQKLILPVTRRDVQLEHCIVPNVPISPQNPEVIQITILLRSIAPQNLMLPSSVNFVIKSFQDFTFYVNIANTQHGMQIGSGTREVDVEHIVGDGEDHTLRNQLRSCQHFLVDSELERARHKSSITQWKLSTKQS